MGYAIEKLIERKSAEGLKIQAKIIPWEKVETITQAVLKKHQDEQ
jgi:hypothetical protein